MEFSITTKKENPLLQRVEIVGKLTFEGVTPSNKEVSALLAKECNTTPEAVVLKRIGTAFGQKLAVVKALVYKDAEAKGKVELVPPHLRQKDAKPKKEGE